MTINPVIPWRCNRCHKREYDRYLYKERHLIECFPSRALFGRRSVRLSSPSKPRLKPQGEGFNKIKHYRRIFSRFDKLVRNYMSFLCLVAALNQATLKYQHNLEPQ